MRFKKSGLLRPLIILGFVLALIAAACGDDDTPSTTTAAPGTPTTAVTPTTASGDLLDQLQEAGVVRIGISNEVPYGYEDENGEVTGEAPEVAKAVLASLGINEVEAVVVDFGALIPGLQANQFDMIAAGMFITSERAENVIFSDPDYCVSESMLVEAGNPFGLTDYDSIAGSGAVIAVAAGTVEEGYLQDLGIPGDQIETFADINAQYDALLAGRVDAVTGTALTINTKAEELGADYEAVPGFFPVINGVEQVGCGGFGFADQGFRDAFNAALKELQADGTVKEIVTSFGFAEADVDRAEATTAAELIGG